MANKPLKTIKFPGLPDTYTVPQVDSTPTQGSSNAVSSGGVYEAIGEINSIINLEEKKHIPFTIVGIGYIASNGNVGTRASEASYTDYVDVSEYEKIIYTRRGVSASTTAHYDAFYNANKEFISSRRNLYNQESDGYTEVEYTLPEGAVYARFTTWYDTATYGNFAIYRTNNVLVEKFSELEGTIADKVDKETGKGLSTNDYTSAEKTKLAGIESGATAVLIDSTPTQGSSNAVSSGGVWSALQNIDVSTDTTLSVSGKPADAKAVGDSIELTQQTIEPTDTEPYAGYWSRNVSTGKVVLASTDIYRTLENPIDVSSIPVGAKVSLLASVNSSYGAFVFDANYNTLDYVNGQNAEEKGYSASSEPQIVTFILPDNAKYIVSDIRAVYYAGMSDFNITIVTTAITDLKIRMALVEAETAEIASISEKIGGGATTIMPDLNSRKSGYYSRNVSTNKLVYADTSNYYTVEPIDISDFVVGSSVQMKSSVTSAYGIFITDSGMNVLDYVNGSNAEEKGYSATSTPQLVTLTVPVNAKYITSDIRSAFYGDMNDFSVQGIRKDNINLLQEKTDSLSLNGNVLSGKKWVACGDSFTAGAFSNSLTNDYIFADGLYSGNNKVYPFWIGRRNPDLAVINEAISGSTMTGGTNGVNAFSETRYINIPADADYITLEFGINDSGNSLPIGTINDDTNETFYGAWNVVLDYFMQNFPFAHIGIIVGPGMQTSNAQTYAEAEIAIAKKWGIPYLNIQFESGGGKIPLMLRTSNPDVASSVKAIRDNQQYVNPNEGTLNMHPNEKAHEFESTFIESWLRTL